MKHKAFLKENIKFSEIEILLTSIKLYKNGSDIVALVRNDQGLYDVVYESSTELLENSKDWFYDTN